MLAASNLASNPAPIFSRVGGRARFARGGKKGPGIYCLRMRQFSVNSRKIAHVSLFSGYVLCFKVGGAVGGASIAI